MRYSIEETARRKVRSLKRLYRHMSVYSIMGVFFFLLNVVTSPFEMWFFFPLLPWGVIVAIHYILVIRRASRRKLSQISRAKQGRDSFIKRWLPRLISSKLKRCIRHIKGVSHSFIHDFSFYYIKSFS